MEEARLLNEKATLQKNQEWHKEVKGQSGDFSSPAVSWVRLEGLQTGGKENTQARNENWTFMLWKVGGAWRERKKWAFFLQNDFKNHEKLPLHELVQPAEALPGLPLQLAAGPS